MQHLPLRSALLKLYKIGIRGISRTLLSEPQALAVGVAIVTPPASA